MAENTASLFINDFNTKEPLVTIDIKSQLLNNAFDE